MESTMVIKVRYGDTLRRFNAGIKEDGQLALDLEGLRAKVLGLFNFPADAEINLTYVDEDGDVVTLVEDYDLQDVTRQNLKFLRVEVTLGNAKDGLSQAASSGSSTPLRSPVQSDVASGVADVLKTLPPQLYEAVSKISRAAASGSQTRSGVPQVLKSVQQPLSEALTKLSHELAKTGSSAPVITDLVDHLSKMGLSYISTNQQPQAASNAGAANDATAPYTVPSASDGSPKEGSAKSGAASASTQGGPGPSKPVSVPVDLNLDPPSVVSPLRGASGKSAQPMVNTEAGKKTTEQNDGVHGSGNNRQSWELYSPPSSSTTVKSAQPVVKAEAGNETKEQSAGTHVSNDNMQPWGYTCPFSGVPLDCFRPPPPQMKPFKRCHSRRNDGMVGLFHRGVQCDVCGIHPIAGPRYKSKVKENYDLCSVCFAGMGDEADYIKMDKPMSYRHSRSLRGLNFPATGWMNQSPPPARFDSRFISDVNVVDGTIVAPSTAFTKIWRLRNSGGLVWPQGTQLVWIGGDRFSQTDMVELEIPGNGLPLEAELDVAIDFTSPALPGRYISYWRTASPSGTRFGQRIWVLIQVESPVKDSYVGSSQGFNLNLPPVTAAAPQRPEPVINVNSKAAVVQGYEEPFGSTSSSRGMMPDQPMPVVDQPEENFPVNDTLLVGKPTSARSSPRPSPTISYPMIDLSDASAPSISALLSSPPTATDPQGMDVDDDNDVEKTLLKELEEMGFKQINLNKEILRMNEYNLEQSLDDLCGVGEWDPILEELKEMGFNDDEMNKKLLKKNNGSIKRVVMDILTGEKA